MEEKVSVGPLEIIISFKEEIPPDGMQKMVSRLDELMNTIPSPPKGILKIAVSERVGNSHTVCVSFEGNVSKETKSKPIDGHYPWGAGLYFLRNKTTVAFIQSL